MRVLSGAAVALVAASQVSTADQLSSAPAAALESVTVTATRIASNTFDVPAAISSVPAQQLIDDALGINLSDDIATVPGLLARDRNNYAQDQQISIRGIGANSAFGVRGVRIYQDGIPATGADGQGQVSQLNLDSAARVEVLRGPFSALYGNSSGGVIQVFTADGARPDQVRASAAYGSFDVWRAGLDASGAAGDSSYNAAFTHFSVDGYRPHSAAENNSFNAKLGYQVDERNHLALILNVISRPDAQDPLGLTSAQFAAAPNQAAPAALLYDTRKSLQQQQARPHLEPPAHRQSILPAHGLRRRAQRAAIPRDPPCRAAVADQLRRELCTLTAISAAAMRAGRGRPSWRGGRSPGRWG